MLPSCFPAYGHSYHPSGLQPEARVTTGAVQVCYDYPGVNSATEREITLANVLGCQSVEVQDTNFGIPLQPCPRGARPRSCPLLTTRHCQPRYWPCSALQPRP